MKRSEMIVGVVQGWPGRLVSHAVVQVAPGDLELACNPTPVDPGDVLDYRAGPGLYRQCRHQVCRAHFAEPEGS